MTDLVMGTGCHGSIKYANKELPFSSRLRGRPHLSDGKFQGGDRIRGGDQERAYKNLLQKSSNF